MNASGTVTDTRHVAGFNRIFLKGQHENELIITQGARESLTIRGPVDLVQRVESEVKQGTLVIGTGGGWLERIGDALATSLTRQRIRYEVTVKNLASIEVWALASVYAAELKAERLALRFNGVGEMRIDSLNCRSLEVSLTGACKVELAGHVSEQQVTIGGPARYEAPRLQAYRSGISVNGIGCATVWSARELDVSVRGPGLVAYYGSPRIRRSLAPMGRLSCLGEQPTERAFEPVQA